MLSSISAGYHSMERGGGGGGGGVLYLDHLITAVHSGTD